MSRKPADMEGKTIGALRIIREITENPRNRKFLVSCVRCGKEKEMLGGNIRRAANTETGGCRCVQSSKCLPPFRVKHGLSGHPLYGAWDGMIRRCYRESHVHFSNYGGRGIGVCEEWRDGPTNFIEWATANGWEPGLQIDRKNNDEGYNPSNCRFVPPIVNMNNRRANRHITVRGKKYTIAQASRVFGVGKTTIKERLNRGWPDEQSVSSVVR